jgi:hypothetical protein
MSNLAQQIFAVDDIESELLEIAQWNVTVLVKSMTAKDRARMIGRSVQANGNFDLEEVLPDLVIHCTFDPETGERVFTPADREMLMSKAASAIELIATVAMRLSGMDEDAIERAGKGL